MSRCCSVLVVLLASCGGGSQVAQTGSGVATDKPGAPGDGSGAVIGSRDAPVPEITDDDEVLVYLRAGSVWLMKANGSDAVQLSVRAHEYADQAPALSPDGTKVAYAAGDDNGVFRIQVVSLDEMIPEAVTEQGTEPSWSPNSMRIAFMRGTAPEQRSLYVYDVQSGAEMLLIEGDDDQPELVGTPAWSPDGTQIVFSADRRQGHGTLLWSVDVISKKLRRVTSPKKRTTFVRDLQPAWSPDGTHIAFASNRHVPTADDAGDLDIYSIAADGSGLAQLTSDPGVATDPTYSPDGKRILFVSDRDQKNAYESELYVMAAGGGQQKRLTRDERPQNAAPSTGRSK